MGLRAVLAKELHGFTCGNLTNFASLPLTFTDPAQYEEMPREDVLQFADLRHAHAAGNEIVVRNVSRGLHVKVRHRMSPRQVELVISGGLINWTMGRLSASSQAQVTWQCGNAIPRRDQP